MEVEEIQIEQKITPINWDTVSKDGLVGASGKLYKICDYLSTERYTKLLQYEQDVFVSGGYETIRTRIQAAIDHYDNGQASKGIYELQRLLEGSYLSITDYPAHMKLCALILNSEDEDQTVFSEQSEKDKIADWKQYDCASFFQLAASMVTGLKKSYLESLEAAKRKKDLEA